MMNLNKILEQLLKTHDLNVSQLSRKTGISAKTLHNWINGQEPRSFNQVHKVANYFGVSIDYICGFDPVEIKKNIDPLKSYMEEEIYAGKFEVILRRIKR